MDEEALVDELLIEGQRLAEGLDKRGHLGIKAVWGLDVERGQWQLILGLPKDQSRLRTYENIQDEIRHQDLSLSLDRIVLARSSEAGFTEMFGSASLAPDSRAKNLGPIEVAGRAFTMPRRMQHSAKHFEDEVLGALSRIVGDADLWHFPAGPPYFLPRSLQPDAVITLPGETELVEIKGTRSPVSIPTALQCLGMLAACTPYSPSDRTSMILVSRAGFAPSVVSLVHDLRFRGSRFAQGELRLVHWRGGHDISSLEAAIKGRNDDSEFGNYLNGP